jgi:hypothetical protein
VADRTLADLVSEWQTGALLVVVPVLVSGVAVVALGDALPPRPLVRVGLFVGGVALAFLVLSYLAYGRGQG